MSDYHSTLAKNVAERHHAGCNVYQLNIGNPMYAGKPYECTCGAEEDAGLIKEIEEAWYNCPECRRRDAGV